MGQCLDVIIQPVSKIKVGKYECKRLDEGASGQATSEDTFPLPGLFYDATRFTHISLLQTRVNGMKTLG